MSQAPTEAPATTDPAVEDPTTETPETGADDTGDETEDARVKRANRQAAAYRTERNQLRAELDEIKGGLEQSNGVLAALRQALTGETNPEADPAEVAQRVTAEAETLRTTNRQLQAELAVHSLAGDLNANPSALLDSRRFTDALHGLDPSADDYREQVAEAIKEAVNANANLRAGQVPPGRGGAEGAGSGSSTPGGVTQEQFDAMGYTKRAELFQSNPDVYRRLAGSAT